MRKLLLALILSLSTVAGFAADIASVNFKAIEDDLREYYFTKPENAGTKSKYEAAKKEDQNRQDAMQKQIVSGKFDLKSAGAMRGHMEVYELEKSIEANLKKELYLIVSEMGLKYELNYDASEGNTIVFAKTQIDDLTHSVKQELIKLTRKK